MRLLFFITTLVTHNWALPSNHYNVKIFGGNIAKPGQFPFIVSINMESKGHLCGGSIINKNWILTAAHCTIDFTKEEITILAGTNLLNGTGTTYNLSTIIVHPNYNRTIHTNDLALFKIDGDFHFSELIQPIQLGAVSVDSNNESVTVIGWGKTDLYSNYPNELHFANLETLSFDDCNKRAQGGAYNYPRGPGQICTLGPEGTAPCFGDSGGPLIFNGSLVGVVSYAIQPCALGFPDVYARVSFYMEWIKENSKI